MRARDLLDRMAAEEEAFLRSSFIAPVIRGSGVRVRVAGVIWEFRVTPAEFEGWAVLEPVDHRSARVVSQPGLKQVREYLDVFPAVPLVASERREDRWLGILAADAGPRVRLEGPAPVLLAREVQLFETMRTRWDGGRFLFDGRHPRRDPSIARYLRDALLERRKPEELSRKGLSTQERAAYEWQHLLLELEQMDRTEERLRQAVAHADGRLRSFIERGDAYTVTFDVDGHSHTAAIRKNDDLTVMAAGICLSGEDRKFDLTSLVGVIREGRGG